MTKTLANRLKKYLSDFIYPDETGFVKGRYIGTNIRIAEDIILYTSQDEEPSWLLALDFKKAFDSVSWECIIETLELFGFGDNFLTLKPYTMRQKHVLLIMGIIHLGFILREARGKVVAYLHFFLLFWQKYWQL